jgi:FAD/FMN-containing dehydrogenase
MTALADRLLMPFDERYEPARLAAIWNGRKTTRRPAAIVHARDASDVQAAVRLAAHNGWRVSIRSGGHSWVATGVRDDALLLDLSGHERDHPRGRQRSRHAPNRRPRESHSTLCWPRTAWPSRPGIVRR